MGQASIAFFGYMVTNYVCACLWWPLLVPAYWPWLVLFPCCVVYWLNLLDFWRSLVFWYVQIIYFILLIFLVFFCFGSLPLASYVLFPFFLLFASFFWGTGSKYLYLFVLFWCQSCQPSLVVQFLCLVGSRSSFCLGICGIFISTFQILFWCLVFYVSGFDVPCICLGLFVFKAQVSERYSCYSTFLFLAFIFYG